MAGLPDNDTAIVILEGISMYLKNDEVNQLFVALEKWCKAHCYIWGLSILQMNERTKEKKTWQTL